MNTPQNPLTEREQRIVEANNELNGEESPLPECDLTVAACDLTDDGTLYVSYEEDGVGLQSRTQRGETDGDRVPAEYDPTLPR